MTYVFKKVVAGKELEVEYVVSSVTNEIKVVDMTVDGKFHRLNWMSKKGQEDLIWDLEQDLTDRACQTGEFDLDTFLDDTATEYYEMKAELAYGV